MSHFEFFFHALDAMINNVKLKAIQYKSPTKSGFLLLTFLGFLVFLAGVPFL